MKKSTRVYKTLVRWLNRCIKRQREELELLKNIENEILFSPTKMEFSDTSISLRPMKSRRFYSQIRHFL